jgi:hypothetical protein
MVMEIKIFPIHGFNNQQKREHFSSILEKDLPKLGAFPDNIYRCSLFVDGANYLDKQITDAIINKRDNICSGVELFFFRFQENNWILEQM